MPYCLRRLHPTQHPICTGSCAVASRGIRCTTRHPHARPREAAKTPARCRDRSRKRCDEAHDCRSGREHGAHDCAPMAGDDSKYIWPLVHLHLFAHPRLAHGAALSRLDSRRHGLYGDRHARLRGKIRRGGADNGRDERRRCRVHQRHRGHQGIQPRRSVL